jgi:sugar phosphate isomerase/epimerase
MFDVAVSELTCPRWDLQHEVERAAAHGFDAISLWRPKVSDVGAVRAAAMVAAAGVRVSSLQWAGGFTGGDGRSFAESVDDADEAIATAATLGAPVLIVHSGCRGGHTRSHAFRLLVQALEELAPRASRAGVALALKPTHPGSGANSSFLGGLVEVLELVERFGDAAIRVAIDLWHFADAPEIEALIPRMAASAVIVNVADRCGEPTAHADRLPAGHGTLPLERLISDLVADGFDGAVEFDPVGEAAEILGYDGVWRETSLVAEAWADRIAVGCRGGLGTPSESPRADVRGVRPAHLRAGSSSRRSHASSHTGSPG